MDSSKLLLKISKAINKSNSLEVQIDDVPPELLLGDKLDLHRWTLIVSDSTMKRIANRPPGKYHLVDPGCNTTKQMFGDFAPERESRDGVTNLDISGSKLVTEFGLSVFARKHVNLKYLNIAGCSKIRDVGLREIGSCCPNLGTLIMTGCHGIEGSGFIAVADCCRFLRKLDVSKCKALQNFGLTKIFYDCNKLEDVNVSYLNTFGDEELRVLAQNCPDVISLTAKECPYVSDQGILAISQHCAELDALDLSRSQMQFRITDVSLLALGQRTASLRLLYLNGCDQITDVGLNWLAEGCKVLEELEIADCSKVTDAGLRSIGSHCHAMTSVDISRLKLVSDIGITSLCSGCPQLKKLVAAGLFFLADPRLSAPAKGEKVEAWQAVVGIAAVEKYCPLLEHLSLAGCFRLDKAIRLHVSGLVALKVVNLQGCYQVSPEALLAVAKNCMHIEELTLSDCGASVNNATVVAFAESCQNLRVVILARCENVKGQALKAISNLPHLEKLDITGCKNVTDMMMLPLTEVGKVPKLRNLILTGAVRVTDATIAWISSKDHLIMMLSVRGSSITRHGLHSVEDYFPMCDILDNDNYLGFWPKPRIEDKKLLNKYHHTTKGVTKLQARVRGIIERKMVANMDRDRKILDSSLVLQCAIRCFLARRRVFHKRVNIVKRQKASIVVTSVMRIPAAIAELRRLRAAKFAAMRNYVCTRIQTRWRIVAAKKVLNRLRVEWERYCNRRYYGCVVIQSLARMYFARCYSLQIRKMRAAREALELRNSEFIQRIYRGHLGRKRTVHILKSKKERLLLTIRCANKIRRCYRSAKMRVNLAARIYRRVTRHNASIKIQALMRGYLARDFLSFEKILQEQETRLWAVTMLQKRWRMKAAYIVRKKLAFERHQLNIKRNIAAITLQKLWRGKLGRRIFYALKEAHLERLRQQAYYEIQGAIKIQALFRGNKGRARYADLIRQRKGFWKELFDEDKQKRFFYNKLTGEVRWRMPQDLLDLIPRPQCDNCQFYEATLECYVCNEVYCGQCFGQVHHGGRRKDHEFRTLYDYYNKRIDYGDGDFPCKWPTEVVQDEIQGWMLRVAPIRDPLAVHGDWEQYNEIAADGSAGPSFFFNRKTFEASYDQPVEVTQAIEAQTNLLLNSTSTGYYDASGSWVVADQGNYSGYYGSDTYAPDTSGRWDHTQGGYGAEIDYSIAAIDDETQNNPVESLLNRPLTTGGLITALDDARLVFDNSFQFHTGGAKRPTLAGVLDTKLASPVKHRDEGTRAGRQKKTRNDAMINSGKFVPKKQLSMKIKPT